MRWRGTEGYHLHESLKQSHFRRTAFINKLWRSNSRKIGSVDTRFQCDIAICKPESSHIRASHLFQRVIQKSSIPGNHDFIEVCDGSNSCFDVQNADIHGQEIWENEDTVIDLWVLVSDLSWQRLKTRPRTQFDYSLNDQEIEDFRITYLPNSDNTPELFLFLW